MSSVCHKIFTLPLNILAGGWRHHLNMTYKNMMQSLKFAYFIYCFTSCVSRHWMGTVGGYQGHDIGPLSCHKHSKDGSGHGMPNSQQTRVRSDGLWGFWCDLCCHDICLRSSCLWCPVSHLVLLLPSILSISVSKVVDGLVTLAATNIVQFLFCLLFFILPLLP